MRLGRGSGDKSYRYRWARRTDHISSLRGRLSIGAGSVVWASTVPVASVTLAETTESCECLLALTCFHDHHSSQLQSQKNGRLAVVFWLVRQCLSSMPFFLPKLGAAHARPTYARRAGEGIVSIFVGVPTSPGPPRRPLMQGGRRSVGCGTTLAGRGLERRAPRGMTDRIVRAAAALKQPLPPGTRNQPTDQHNMPPLASQPAPYQGPS